MRSRMTFLLLTTICSIHRIVPVGAEYQESFETWQQINIEFTGNFWTQTTIVPYYPDGIIYADKIDRGSGGDPNGMGPATSTPLIVKTGETSEPNEVDERLDLDLVLRVVPELSESGQKDGSLFATIWSINKDVSLEDLDRCNVMCLDVFHGKIYIGVSAGPNNIYRGWLYVTESVAQGHGLSRPFYTNSLQGAVLSMDGILPGSPYLGYTPPLPPTAIRLQIRTAATEADLYESIFIGPDGTADTYFVLDPAGEQSRYKIDINSTHQWFQYKVIMSTSDMRVTPVLQKVALATPDVTVVHDTDWCSGQLMEYEGLDCLHSPGEVVLANKRLPDGQVSIIKVIQPPSVQPPDWIYHIKGQNRAFPVDGWPYTGIGEMEPFQGNLYLRLGPHVFAMHTCTAGDLVCYHFASGLFNIEGHYYHHEADPNNPTHKTLWGEGGGKLTTMGDLLIDPQRDSKIGIWIEQEQRYTHSEGEEWYMLTDGRGEWKLGFLPSRIHRRYSLHIWDMIMFAGKHFASTNEGVIFRSPPLSDRDHLRTDTWEYFGFGYPEGADQYSMAATNFSVFDRHLIVSNMLCYLMDDEYVLLYKREVVNHDFESVLVEEIDPNQSLAAQCHIEYEGRLIFWHEDTLYFTNPRLRAIPPGSSLIWQKDQAQNYHLPVEGGKLPLHWEIVNGKLPLSITLNEAQGVLSGTPHETGAFDIVLKVTDSCNPQAESFVSYSIVVKS